MRDVEFILTHGKVVIPYFSLGLHSVCRYEILFVNFTERLTEGITDDVSVSDLLINSRVED